VVLVVILFGISRTVVDEVEEVVEAVDAVAMGV